MKTVLLTLTLAAVGVYAADYALNWHTIQPGGVSTGGGYRVEGVAGQPDAGISMTGGIYAVSGGFYPHVEPRTSATVLHSFDLVISNGEVVIIWTSATEDDCAGYRIYRDDGGWVQVSGDVAATGGGSTYDLVDPDAVEGQTYSYRVVALDGEGGTDTLGEYECAPFALRFQSPIRVVGKDVVIRWLSREDKTYRLLAATSVTGAYIELEAALPATPPENVHTQDMAGIPTRFFRIEEK